MCCEEKRKERRESVRLLRNFVDVQVGHQNASLCNEPGFLSTDLGSWTNSRGRQTLGELPGTSNIQKWRPIATSLIRKEPLSMAGFESKTPVLTS